MAFYGSIDFRTSPRNKARLIQHHSGVSCRLYFALTPDGNVNVCVKDIVSNDHRLKSVNISFHRVSVVRGKIGCGPKFASTVKTDFRFDGEAEHLIEISKESGELYFFVNCNADVEEWRSLLGDLKRLYLKNPDNPAFADTTLECQGIELKCHSFVLTARSTVFETALTQSGFLEAQTRKIKIEEMDVDILRKMIRFIYTDVVDDKEAYASTLFHAADRYDLPKLRTLCLKMMLKNVNASNAADYFHLAYLHGHLDLKREAAAIIRNQYDVVKASSGWPAFEEDPRLLQDFVNVSFSRK